MAVQYLNKELLETICYRLAKKYFESTDDPIGPFEDHDPALLDSALNLPRATFDGKDLYPHIEQKAAILYYALNKNHPFGNGNKRIATAGLLVFLYLNDYRFLLDPENLANMTIKVARSMSGDKEKILLELADWVARHIQKA